MNERTNERKQKLGDFYFLCVRIDSLYRCIMPATVILQPPNSNHHQTAREKKADHFLIFCFYFFFAFYFDSLCTHARSNLRARGHFLFRCRKFVVRCACLPFINSVRKASPPPLPHRQAQPGTMASGVIV